MFTKQLVFTICTIVVGSSFQYGYQTGVINAPSEKILAFINTTYAASNNTISPATLELIGAFIVAAFPIGGLFGALLAGILANEFGRKLTLLIAVFPTIFGSVLMTISYVVNWYPAIIIGRIVIGVSCGVYTSIAPMYLSEIAPLQVKGAAGTINQFVIVIGVLVSQIFGLEFILGGATTWPYLLGFSLIPSVLQFVLLMFCPESPRYLLITANNEIAAYKALMFLRNSDNVDYEIQEMIKERETARSIDDKSHSILDLFKRKYLRMALFISVGMQITQQFSGINSVIYYSEKIFEKSGFSELDSSYATIGVGAVNVFITFVSVLLVDRLGRKTLHLTGMVGMFFASLLLTVCFIVRQYWQPTNYFAMVFVFIYVAFFGIGPGSIPWFITAEIFTQTQRGNAMTIATFINWVGQIIIGIGFPPLLNKLGNYNFVPFNVMLLLFIGFTIIYVPETKGRTPEELENYFKRKADGISLNDDDEALLINNSIGPIMVDDDNDYRI